jgi:hypothetical protein
MREIRTMASWVIALFLAVMLVLAAVDILAPAPPTQNHLFEVFRDASGISYFEPTGRFGVGVLAVVAALLMLLPVTRRVGAILAFLITVGIVALVAQLVVQQIPIPVDTVVSGADGQNAVETTSSDGSQLLYLSIGLVVASLALIFVHPGSDATGQRGGLGYYGR